MKRGGSELLKFPLRTIILKQVSSMHVHGVSAHIASYISKYTRKGINPTGEGGAVNETQSLNNVASNRRHVHICEYTLSKLV